MSGDIKEASPGSGAESVSTSGSSTDGSYDHSPELELGMGKQSSEDLIPVPPPNPKNGVSILAHKIWIGNLDKRLTE